MTGIPENLNLVPHQIPAGVFALVDDEGVVLDLQSNRYLALGRTSALIWKQLAAGESAASTAARLAEALVIPRTEAAALVAEQVRIWREFGLAGDTKSSDSVLPEPRCLHPADPASALDRRLVDASRLVPAAVAQVLIATLGYRRYLRRYGLGPSILHIHRAYRNDRYHHLHEHHTDVLLEIVKAYSVIRRVYWERQNDCVARSLGLTAALCRRGIDAHITIGVTMLPFRAHAWVEVDNMVVNERLGVVREFRPLVQF